MKKNTIIDAFIGVLVAISLIWFILKIINIKTPKQPSYIELIILTNTDTLYKEIEILKLKRDTIKLYYEKKINNYRTLPTPERVQLFSDRITR